MHPFDSREPNPPRADDARRRELLAGLDGRPALHIARALLSSQGCDVVEAEPHGHGCCLVADDEALVFVLGRPGGRALRYALASWGAQAECLCLPEDADHVQEGLPNWSPTAARLHLADVPPAGLDRGPGLDWWRGRRSDLAHLEPELADRVLEMVARGGVLAAWADGRPVSFCMAPFLTDEHWDTEVETAPAWRGRRLAERAWRAMLGVQREQGREPIWGATVSNRASLALAARLGLRVVDELVVFERAAR